MLYTQAMQEISERRKIEWQTFIVVNAIYLGTFKILYDYKGMLTLWQSIMITITAVFFTYIWFIRIYANGRRSDFSIHMRNRAYSRLDPNLRTPHSTDISGGFVRWYKDWPLWAYRGVCVAILAYCIVLVAGVWWYRTAEPLFSIYIDLNDSIAVSLNKAFKAEGIKLSKGITSLFNEVDNAGDVYIFRKAGDTMKVYRRMPWPTRGGYSFLACLLSTVPLFVFSLFDWWMIAKKKKERWVICIDCLGDALKSIGKDRKADIPCGLMCRIMAQYNDCLEGAKIERVFRCWVITDAHGNQQYYVRKKIGRRQRYSIRRLE